MVYSSTTCGDGPEKNGGHIKNDTLEISALHYSKTSMSHIMQALLSASMGNGTINFAGEYR